MKTKNKFYFEITDTFSGELNYSWLNRFTIEAKNLKGALCKLSKHTGLNFRHDGLVYKAKKACIATYQYRDGYELPDNQWLEKSEVI